MQCDKGKSSYLGSDIQEGLQTCYWKVLLVRLARVKILQEHLLSLCDKSHQHKQSWLDRSRGGKQK